MAQLSGIKKGGLIRQIALKEALKKPSEPGLSFYESNDDNGGWAHLASAVDVAINDGK